MEPSTAPCATRPATPDDLAAMTDLIYGLFSAEPEFVPDRPTQARGLALILADPRIGEILVAEADGRVVGMVSLLYTVSTALGGKVAVLEDMVMESAWRGRGCGSVLCAAALAHARAAGCLRVTLLTEASNAGAQRFYARLGFAKSSMIPMRVVF
jgi:GNAT superfamily N-acetyltransferase